MKATWDEQAAALRSALDDLKSLKQANAQPLTVDKRLAFVEKRYTLRLDDAQARLACIRHNKCPGISGKTQASVRA